MPESPPEKVQLPRGVYATLHTSDPMPIYLTDDGRFAANVNSRWEVRSSLAAVNKLHAKAARPVKVFSEPGRPYAKCHTANPHVITAVVIGERGRTSYRDGNGKLCRTFGDRFYLWSDDIVAKLEALEAKTEAVETELVKEYHAIMAEAKKLPLEKFDDFQEGTYTPQKAE